MKAVSFFMGPPPTARRDCIHRTAGRRNVAHVDVPCVVLESRFSNAFESFRPLANAPTAAFESPSESLGMARTTRNYACQLGRQRSAGDATGMTDLDSHPDLQEYKDILFQSISELYEWDTRLWDWLV
jgi:hypothetical protein